MTQELEAARRSGRSLGAPDLRGLSGLIEHVPEDMTATAGCGMPWNRLQSMLASKGQWLPLDPCVSPETTLGDVLNQDLFGPNRLGSGKARDYVLGLKVMLANGQVISPGGKVVKNVAGFDLCKLFIGAAGSLGILLEATVKLLPIPELEAYRARVCPLGTPLQTLLSDLQQARISPCVLDAHSLPGVPGHARVVIGFSGSRTTVDWQTHHAEQLGFTEPADLSHDHEFWAAHPRSHVLVQSLPTSQLAAKLAALRSHSWICRLGNGLIYSPASDTQARPPQNSALERLTKQLYDPDNLLPPLPSRL